MARKTIEIAQLKAKANSILANSHDNMRAQREGVATFLEAILLESDGNYKGFSYLESEYMPADKQTSSQVLRPGYDDTRRRYF